MIPATYDFPTFYRGDTLAAFALRLSQDGEALTPVRVRMNVVTPTGKIVLAWDTEDESVVMDGATAIFTRKEAEVMRQADVGKWTYDIETTFADGTVATYLAGKFPIIADKTV